MANALKLASGGILGADPSDLDQTLSSSFDLAMSYPQWQGSGRARHLPQGAQTAASVCSRFAPLAQISDAGAGETVGGINHWTAIVDQFRQAQEILARERPRRILTAGGDCACDVAVIDYLHGLYSDLTVIWVDAHFDANTQTSTPSGNFHGMPVAAIMGHAPNEMQALLKYPLPPSQFRYFTVHIGDDGDKAFSLKNALRWWDPSSENFSGPIHIHFDLDALIPAEFPHVAYPDGNLGTSAGLDIVGKLARDGDVVGLTITEFAPVDTEAAVEGGRYIAELCEVALHSRVSRGS